MKREGIHLEIRFPFGSLTRLKRGGWSAPGALQEILSSWQRVSVKLIHGDCSIWTKWYYSKCSGGPCSWGSWESSLKRAPPLLPQCRNLQVTRWRVCVINLHEERTEHFQICINSLHITPNRLHFWGTGNIKLWHWYDESLFLHIQVHAF